jgi:hypothetical protein
MQQFNEKYKDVSGKTDSMYIYVLYGCPQEKILDHIKKQLDHITRIQDSYKRNLFSSRYYLFRDLVEKSSESHQYNDVMFIGDQITIHPMTQGNKILLKKYDHEQISFVYDDHYKLDYLEDLLFNDKPYHIYRINNNKIDYLQMTRTKKIILQSKESKQFNVMDFINSTLPINARYAIYGISAKIKEHQDDRAYCVIRRSIKDNELMDLINTIDQEDHLIALDKDLLMIHDARQSHKIIFKDHILKKIKTGQLEKLYIDKNLHIKFLENTKKHSIDINFKIIIIDTGLKSFVENREKIIDQYGGVIGVAYY